MRLWPKAQLYRGTETLHILRTAAVLGSRIDQVDIDQRLCWAVAMRLAGRLSRIGDLQAWDLGMRITTGCVTADTAGKTD